MECYNNLKKKLKKALQHRKIPSMCLSPYPPVSKRNRNETLTSRRQNSTVCPHLTPKPDIVQMFSLQKPSLLAVHWETMSCPSPQKNRKIRLPSESQTNKHTNNQPSVEVKPRYGLQHLSKLQPRGPQIHLRMGTGTWGCWQLKQSSAKYIPGIEQG